MASPDIRHRLMMALERSFEKAGDADSFLQIHAGMHNIYVIPDKECERLLTLLGGAKFRIRKQGMKRPKPKPPRPPKPPKSGPVITKGHESVMYWADEADFKGLDVIFVGQKQFILGLGCVGLIRDVMFNDVEHIRRALAGDRIYALLHRISCSHTSHPGCIIATICTQYPGTPPKKGYTWHPIPPVSPPQNKGWDPYRGCWVCLSTRNPPEKAEREKKPELKEDRLPPGPEPERLKIDMPFEEAVKKALRTKPSTQKRESQ